MTASDKAALAAYLRKWGKDKGYYYYVNTPHQHTPLQTRFARVVAGYMSALGYSHVYVHSDPSGMGKWGVPAGKVGVTFEH